MELTHLQIFGLILLNIPRKAFDFNAIGQNPNPGTWSNFRVLVASPLVGKFNVSNCLAALSAAVCGLGISPEVAAVGIAAMPGVPGRMERIDPWSDHFLPSSISPIHPMPCG